jgi:hypothetical protein
MVPKDVLDMLSRMKNWSTHFETSHAFPTGIYPLAFANNTLYFTDVEEYACLDCNWAKDHIYSVACNPITMTSYSPVKGNYKCIKIQAGCLTSTTDLFKVIQSAAKNELDGFMHDSKGHKLDITYTDKHLKSQLGMIIATKFIKELISNYQLSIFDINFIGQNYTDTIYGRHKNDIKRFLSVNLYDDSERDSILNDFMQWCPATQLSIRSQPALSQHFRDLVVRDVVTGKSIALLPDGGFQNGWYVDSARTNGLYYGITSNEDSNIPIINQNLLKFHVEIE